MCIGASFLKEKKRLLLMYQEILFVEETIEHPPMKRLSLKILMRVVKNHLEIVPIQAPSVQATQVHPGVLKKLGSVMYRGNP